MRFVSNRRRSRPSWTWALALALTAVGLALALVLLAPRAPTHGPDPVVEAPARVSPPPTLRGTAGVRTATEVAGPLRIHLRGSRSTTSPPMCWICIPTGGRSFLVQGAGRDPWTYHSEVAIEYGTYDLIAIDSTSGFQQAYRIEHLNADPQTVTFTPPLALLRLHLVDTNGADIVDAAQIEARVFPSLAYEPALYSYRNAAYLLGHVAAGTVKTLEAEPAAATHRATGPEIELNLPSSGVVQLTVAVEGYTTWSRWLSVPAAGKSVRAVLHPDAQQVIECWQENTPVRQGYRVVAYVSRVTQAAWTATTDSRGRAAISGYPANGFPIFVLYPPGSSSTPCGLLDLSKDPESSAQIFGALSTGGVPELDFGRRQAASEEWTVQLDEDLLAVEPTLVAWYSPRVNEAQRTDVLPFYLACHATLNYWLRTYSERWAGGGCCSREGSPAARRPLRNLRIPRTPEGIDAAPPRCGSLDRIFRQEGGVGGA